jgi:Cu2+-exporting ATPase
VVKKVNAIVLDKTGTITEGKPEVTDISWLKHDDNLEEILFSIEKHSEHPLGEAITTYFPGIKAKVVDHFESITGRGARAVVEGTTYFIGNLSLLHENNIQTEDRLILLAETWSKQAKTVIWFADQEKALAVIGIADKIKANSESAIWQLKQSGIEVYMLTGDNEVTARAIADQTRIDDYKAGLLPYQKADFIKELQAKGKIVAMVGDGINDSAALAQADVSIAMGRGSDIAMDVAKMTIVSSDLSKIPVAIRLSRQTVAAVRQNLFWAFIYNIIGIPIAAGILFPFTGFLLNPMIAGAAMAMSSVSVVSNSLRLKFKK